MDAIEWLKRQPKKSAPVGEQVTEPGFYLLDGNVYRVKIGKMSGRPYSELATATGFDYHAGKGAFRSLRPEMKMTGEQIAEHGVSHGFCVVCSTGFEKYISTQLGIGPTCGPKTLGKDVYKAAKVALIASDPRAAAEDAADKAAAKARREAKKNEEVVAA
jgi:hypothetical protein